MKYVSEDSSNAKEGILATKVYGSDSCIFSCSNGLLEDTVLGLLPSEEDIIVYVDVVPGNISTASIFYNLLYRFKDNSNIYIVPILCTEACVLISLESMGHKLVEVHKFILDGKLSYKETEYKDKKTIEKAIKEFYKKEAPIQRKKMGYYKDGIVKIGERLVTLEERSVKFILAHTAYLDNDIISKYSTSTSEILLSDYMDLYFNLYNKIAETHGYKKFSNSKISKLKLLCGNK